MFLTEGMQMVVDEDERTWTLIQFSMSMGHICLIFISKMFYF